MDGRGGLSLRYRPAIGPDSTRRRGTAMRTPALIFDFGNVLAHFDYGRAAEAVGKPIGLSGPELLERVRPLGFSQLLKDYESGRMPSEAFSREVCRLAGVSMSHEAFAAAWADIFWLNESVA